jgi:hypothetical protein
MFDGSFMKMRIDTTYRALGAIVLVLAATRRAYGCEPVVPFVQTVAPMLALSGSLLMLAGAVVVKSVLFTFFERRIPRLRAAWRMLLGNVLTSFVGLLVAAMIGSGPIWFIGIPLVFLLCWLPARRLVREAPLRWLAGISPASAAVIMTGALLASCILFASGQGAISSHQLLLYWIMKLIAISLALFASVTLTTIWEEWAIWRLSSRPEATAFFASVLRTNLYVLVLVMAVPAVLILPRRLRSPGFLARHAAVTQMATAPSR